MFALRKTVFNLKETKFYLKRLHGIRYKRFSGDTSFSQRSHHCGELRSSNIGEHVKLCGWLQYNRMSQFLVLRDAHGLTQVVVPKEKQSLIQNIPYESVLQVTGVVRARPIGEENKKMPTGDVEIIVESANVLNECDVNMPFHVRNFQQANESLRMQHRYLDLRNSQLQQNLRLRSKVVMKIREYLCNMNGFVDVETPTLFRRTPGGAREFVVPTHQPDAFYTLPQSPQQFKQLLMIGGIDRYMQVARCYRDETTRPDRQPEFTQVDIEMSFVNKKNIQDLVEGMLCHCWPEERDKLSMSFPRMSYKDSMRDYGSDKPDTRFDMKLHDVSKLFSECAVGAISSAARNPDKCSVQAVNFMKAANLLSHKELESLIDHCKLVAPTLWRALIKVKEDGSLQGGLNKKISSDSYEALCQTLSLTPGDLLLLSAGSNLEAMTLVGRLRLDVANLLETKGQYCLIPVRQKLYIVEIIKVPHCKVLVSIMCI